MMSPGVLRQFAAQADKDVPHYLAKAHSTDDPQMKRYYLRCAENREDDARWYREVAGRGEIEVEYTRIEPLMEAAE